MYLVLNGAETQEFQSRAEAIAAAKAISAEVRGAVIVRDEEERERLSYHRGQLESYTYDTRSPRKR